jgi:hypothetical protein
VRPPYTRSAINANATGTLLHDEVGNETAYQFTNFGSLWYEIRRQAYQGAAAGTPLLDRRTCYNYTAPPNCVSTALTSGIAQIDTYETLDAFNSVARLSITTALAC